MVADDQSKYDYKTKDTHGPFLLDTIRVRINIGIFKTHPIAAMRFRAAMGKMVLPKDKLIYTNPRAAPSFLLNQCEMAVSKGPKIIPQDIFSLGQSEIYRKNGLIHTPIAKGRGPPLDKSSSGMAERTDIKDDTEGQVFIASCKN